MHDCVMALIDDDDDGDWMGQREKSGPLKRC